jgi:hypothetical protein
MVTWSEDVLRVNLLLNHATHRADVYSYSPYEGRLDLKIKSKCGKILNHAPEWVEQDSDALSVCVNGKERAHAWEGRYVCVGSGNPDDTVVMTYPMTGYMIKEQLGDGIYTLTLKGNTVIDINPPGRHCPLYQRAHYREERVRWRKIQRFVAEEGLRW